jgi:hypothetical protein
VDEDSYPTTLVVNGREIFLEIHDTVHAPSADSDMFHPGFIKVSDGILIVFSLARRSNFEAIEYYYKDAIQHIAYDPLSVHFDPSNGVMIQIFSFFSFLSLLLEPKTIWMASVRSQLLRAKPSPSN